MIKIKESILISKHLINKIIICGLEILDRIMTIDFKKITKHLFGFVPKVPHRVE